MDHPTSQTIPRRRSLPAIPAGARANTIAVLRSFMIRAPSSAHRAATEQVHDRQQNQRADKGRN